MSVACDVTICEYNNGFGSCELAGIYIPDAETGDPICQYVEFEEIEGIQEVLRCIIKKRLKTILMNADIG